MSLAERRPAPSGGRTGAGHAGAGRPRDRGSTSPTDGGSWLLEGGLVLTMDDAGTSGFLSVAIGDGLITGVDEGDALRDRFPDAVRIDCSNHVLLPGLINAHLHPELHLLKGAVEELNLHDWADAEHFDRALELLSSADGQWIQRAGIRASLADCLLGGATCVATYGVTVGADDVAIEVLAELGMRGFVTVRDAEFAPVAGPSAPRIFRLHAEEALTPGELEAAARAHDRGERIVMHAAETEHRIRLVRERFGTSTVRLLDRYGLLSPRMLLSHAIYTDEEERALLASRGVPVVSSPTAELKLADGIAPIADYLERGVPVALGTDCAVCNNSNDLFLEMKLLGLTQKLRYGADAMPAEQILRMATRHGSRALGGEGHFGAIAVGWSADLIRIDAATPRMQPLVHRQGYSNAAGNLVYAVTGQDVTDVMIAGRWVVRDRRLEGIDIDAVWRDLSHAAAVLHERIL